jgi:UDP-2,3-diacylglucosamine hydrolase
MAVLFISDLHLDPARPSSTDDFIAFTENEARSADRLYILGDLFEAWIGDDDDDPALQSIVAAIRALTDAGTECFFMHGNRDFLIGDRFCIATGIGLLDEFDVIDVEDQKLLLTHGDLLCSDDLRYLELRRQLRDPAWQQEFLARTLDERRRIAADLRQLSQTEMAAKSEAIMDVNEETVRDTMRRFDVSLLLHGHTHRPAMHRFELDGQPATRIVLGDWYGPGGYVRWDDRGPTQISTQMPSGQPTPQLRPTHAPTPTLAPKPSDTAQD